MSELIKREDAIKATWQEPSYTDPLNVLTEVRDRINALPTASPWRRVEEELPENFVRCVIWDGYETDIAYLIRDCPASDKCCWYWRKCGINRKGGKLDFYKVKAWMPLPEPPKEEA